MRDPDDQLPILLLGGAVGIGVLVAILGPESLLAALQGWLQHGGIELGAALLGVVGILGAFFVTLARAQGGLRPWLRRQRALSLARQIAGMAPPVALVARVQVELEREELGLVTPESLRDFAASLPDRPRRESESLVLAEGRADLRRYQGALDEAMAATMSGSALVARVRIGERSFALPELHAALREADAALAAAQGPRSAATPPRSQGQRADQQAEARLGA